MDVPYLRLVSSEERAVKPNLVPIRIHALKQQINLAQKLAQDLEEELSRGMDEKMVLPSIMTQDLVLLSDDSKELMRTMARLAVLGKILEE
jgi:hypothetical protein